jgi:hypothetical protein
MHRSRTERLAWALLALSVVAVAGMLLGRWQLVLYPSLLTVGVLLAMSLVHGVGAARLGVPIGVTGLLVALFGVLHAMGVASPTGSGTLLGWDPMTAVYLFLVGPAFVLVSLLYAVHDRPAATEATAAEETVR